MEFIGFGFVATPLQTSKKDPVRLHPAGGETHGSISQLGWMRSQIAGAEISGDAQSTAASSLRVFVPKGGRQSSTKTGDKSFRAARLAAISQFQLCASAPSRVFSGAGGHCASA